MKNELINILENSNIPYLTKAFKKNEVIFLENDVCEYVSFIKKGSIYMFSYLNDKEIRYNFMHEGDIFGNNLLFSNNNIYEASIISSSSTKIYFVNKNQFLELCRSQLFLENYLKLVSNQILNSKHELKYLRTNPLEDRIILFLKMHNNTYTFKNKSSFAELLNVTRENLSKKLKEMKNKSIIKINNKTITF